MSRLHLSLQANHGLATSFGVSEATAEVAVTDGDGNAVTALAEGNFEIWLSYAENAGGGFQPAIWQLVEMAINGRGPDGAYQIYFGGSTDEGGGGNWPPAGGYFLHLVVTTGGDRGQAVAVFELP